MKKLFVLIISLVLAINFVSALDCQYVEIESHNEFGTWIYDEKGLYFGEPLIVKDFVSKYMNIEGCTPAPSFKIENQYSFPIKISLTYDVFHPHISQFFQESRSTFNKEIYLDSYSEEKVEGTCLDIGNNEIPTDSVKYIFIEPKGLVLKKGFLLENRTICKLCNNQICLNDGAYCSYSKECGSGFCSDNFCLTLEGAKLKRAEKDKIFWMYSIILLPIILAGGIVYILKNMRRKYEQGIKELQIEIKALNKKRTKAKDKTKRLKDKEKNLTLKEEELRIKEQDFEKSNRTFLIKKAIDKYKQRYNHQIYFDENSGYLRFSNNGDYLHRFIYRRKFDTGLGNKVVHHIDADKLNNEDWNLISIPYEKHKELNHTLIVSKDWNSGIQQIKEQLGLKEEDLPKHIRIHKKGNSSEKSY
ncbi:MAG: hypothetical protein ABIB71_06645 [Candidatus Woesearchaeota archaeon]